MFRTLRILIIAIAAFACMPVFADPAIGQQAPSLKAQQLNGSVFNLADEHGHIVLIDVWATWCAPCRAEMPILNAFYQKYRSKGVVLLGLSDDNPRNEGTVRQVMKQFAYPAALMATADKDGFGRPRVVPMTYVFDQHGILRAKLWPGGILVTEKNLENIVDPLLAHQQKGG